MALLILRITPGEMVRWLSGTATHAPDGCAHLEWRPSVLTRVNPASVSIAISVGYVCSPLAKQNPPGDGRSA
jgi:hypothetical protein